MWYKAKMQHHLFSDNNSELFSSQLEDLRSSLNNAQYAAVTHGNGPILVIAGAGSGKTRTLVYRVAYLLKTGIRPESILLLTFTRRAAQEMLWRASRLTDQSCRQVIGGTFHATANMLLHRYGHHIGFGSGFSIIDQSDAEGIINLLKSSLGLSGVGKRFPSKRMLINILSASINRVISVEDLVLNQHPHLIEFLDDIYRIQKEYSQFKLNHGLMDYDDLLTNWQKLLAESREARLEISTRFCHILVDEYQDTNRTQAAIVRLMAHDHDNVMVVGDDAQSIYSFRGADFYNIIRFPKEFPGATIIKLEENYRSTQPILSLTNSIIENAEEKFTKTLFTKIEGGDKPLVYPAQNESGEARFVVETIEKLQNEGTSPTEIAVLFRSGFHSYKLEMELTSRNMVFEKRGGLKLTESAHIKDVLSFFRILVNPWDKLSWSRILLQIDKVGLKTAEKIFHFIQESSDPIQSLTQFKPRPVWQTGFKRLSELLIRLLEKDLAPSGQCDLIMDYYQPIFKNVYHDDYPKRSKDLEQLQTLIAGYGDLQSLIDDTALDPPEASTPELLSSHSQGDGTIVLSTIHSAKGLEWDVVFVIGLAEGRFPHQNSIPGEQWEEERRLLYVAATRARKKVILTYPKELMTTDRKLRRAVMSPFLREINPGLYEKKEDQSWTASSSFTQFNKKRPFTTRTKAKYDPDIFTPGMIVSHPFFGRGKIKAVPGPKRVEVSFDRHGDKLLHLDYAKLEIIQ